MDFFTGANVIMDYGIHAAFHCINWITFVHFCDGFISCLDFHSDGTDSLY